MPQPVIDRLVRYQTHEHANIHRGVHYLSETATAAYEEARRKVQRFINAPEEREVIFTSGTTEAINLVAHGFGRQVHRRRRRDHPHHAGAPLQHRALADAGRREGREDPRRADQRRAASCCVDEYEKLFNARTKFVARDARLERARHHQPGQARSSRSRMRRGVPVLVDGAQAVPHLAVDVQDLDCDFYAFSGHKICGPTGIGVLYGKAALLETMPPFKGGGDMILSVTFEKTTYNAHPAQVRGRHAADRGGDRARRGHRLPRRRSAWTRIAAHEHDLLAYATEQLQRASRACASSARPRRRPRCSRSCSTASIRTTSARCSTRKASRCAPATTARSR